jgi:anti-sigma factor RsiW
MNPQLQEKIQAWVDGELDPSEANHIAATAQSDPAVQALANNLRGLQTLVRNHPPEPTVDASRDFYWSRIRHGIEQAEKTNAKADAKARDNATGTRTSPLNPAQWLAWLIPTAAVATVALFALRPDGLPTAMPASTNPAPVLVEHTVEAPSTEVSTLTFYSAADAMTVVWVGTADIL